MKISGKALDLLRRFEGLRLDAYRCPAGVWTIGYGHTGADVCGGARIGESEAEELLRRDAEAFEEAVARIAGRCSQGQFDALVCFAFNLGAGALKASTLLHKHKAGDHAGAAAQFGRWVHAGGKILPGLVRRRAAEAELYLS